MTRKRQLTIQVSEYMEEALRSEAKRKQCSLGDVVEDYITEALLREGYEEMAYAGWEGE